MNQTQMNAYRTYLGMRAIASFAFSLVITYELVYHTVGIGLSPLQLVSVGVLLETMTFLFETPTGVVADAYSRRLSVLIGLFLTGVGFLIEGLISTFGAVLLAQVFWGIGITFFSGAETAWITDEVGEEKASQAFLRGTQIAQIARLAGIGMGAWLVSYGINTPIIIGAIIYLVLVAGLAKLMDETGFHPTSADPGQRMVARLINPFWEGLRVVKTRPTLLTVVLVFVITGLYIGGFDRLYAAHLT